MTLRDCFKSKTVFGKTTNVCLWMIHKQNKFSIDYRKTGDNFRISAKE